MEARTFGYRRHVRKMQYILVGVMTLGIVLPLMTVTIRDFVSGHFSGVMAGMTLVSAVMVLLGFWLVRTIASTQVTINEEGLRYKTYRKELHLDYEEIQGLGFSSIPYVGGWMEVKNAEHTIRLTVVLEDIGEFVHLLKEQLDARGLEESYDRKKLFQFYKTASYSDQSWSRLYRLFAPILVSTLASMALWFFAVPVDRSTMALDLMMFALVCAPMSGWLLAEVFLLVAFVRQTDAVCFAVPEVNRPNERKWLLVGYGGYALVALLVGLLIF